METISQVNAEVAAGAPSPEVSDAERGVREAERNAYARAWFKWPQRRGQRRHLTWEKFGAMYERYPRSTPRITVRIWVT